MDDAGFYRALGRAVKVMRTQRGLERRELADAAGVSYPYLSEIENGKKRLSAKALLYVSRALGVRPYEILSLAESWEVEEDGTAELVSAVPGEPASLNDALRMLPLLRDNDMGLVLALIERLYRSNPHGLPSSAHG